MASNSSADTVWRTVGSVETSCRILEALHRLNGAGITELSNELDVSKAGIHSHLATLEKNEFVTRDDGLYQISLRFLEFGEAARQNIGFHTIIEEEAKALAARTGEVVHFMVEEHGWGRYICKVQGNSAVQTGTYVGFRQHLHCSGNGKAILSELSEERVEEIINKRGLPKQTENTVTSKEELFDELARIRERGVSFDNEEYIDGIRSVAVPVSNQENGLMGAISAVGPTSRMKGTRFREELPEMLLNSSNVIQINSSHA